MRRLLLILLGLLMLGGAGWYVHVRLARNAATAASGGAGGGRGGTGGQPVPVLVGRAARQDVPVWLDGLGTVQAFNSVTVHSMIDGPLMQVGFQEGQDVKSGDLLALIDPRPTQAALDQATAKKAQDEATLANARLDLVRYAKLVAQNYTSAQTADTQRALVAQEEAQVRQDQAAIDTARTNLSYTTITAPIAGRTGIRQVDAGNIIHTSDSNGLVVITQLQPISVVFSLPQQSLPAVAAAMAAGPVTLTASPQGLAAQAAPPPASAPGTSRQASAAADEATDPPPPAPKISVPLDQGKLAVLDNQVDSSTGTIKLKGTFPNPKLTLWPGGFVNVRLLASTLHDAVTVPPVAVQRGPSGTFVYIVSADNKAQRRPITVGHEDEVVSVVTRGLDGGEVVVVDGASRLSDGSTVSISQPVAPGGGTAPAERPHRRPDGAAPAGGQASGAPRGAT